MSNHRSTRLPRLPVERHWELIIVLVFTAAVLIALFTALVSYTNTTEPAPTAASTPAPTAPPAGVVRTPALAARPPAPAGQTPQRTYRVTAGDTLASVALRHGVDYGRIAADNQLANVNLIHPGQQLRIGQPTPGVHLIQPGETLSGLAHHTGLTVGQLRALNPWITNPNRIPAGLGLRLRS